MSGHHSPNQQCGATGISRLWSDKRRSLSKPGLVNLNSGASVTRERVGTVA